MPVSSSSSPNCRTSSPSLRSAPTRRTPARRPTRSSRAASRRRSTTSRPSRCTTPASTARASRSPCSTRASTSPTSISAAPVTRRSPTTCFAGAAVAVTGVCATLFGESAPKVKGGYDFVGEGWPNTDRTEDPNPIDAGSAAGHGTHVADIIGGRSADGTHEGIAPGVSLYAVKVCSAVSTSCNGVAMLLGHRLVARPERRRRHLGCRRRRQHVARLVVRPGAGRLGGRRRQPGEGRRRRRGLGRQLGRPSLHRRVAVVGSRRDQRGADVAPRRPAVGHRDQPRAPPSRTRCCSPGRRLRPGSSPRVSLDRRMPVASGARRRRSRPSRPVRSRSSRAARATSPTRRSSRRRPARSRSSSTTTLRVTRRASASAARCR